MQPVPRKIQLAVEDNSVAIEWSDGHRSLYPYKFAGEKRPSATLTDARGACELRSANGQNGYLWS